MRQVVQKFINHHLQTEADRLTNRNRQKKCGGEERRETKQHMQKHMVGWPRETENDTETLADNDLLL